MVRPLPSVHHETSLLDWSREVGRTLLQSAEPQRWSHSQQVARVAAELASTIGEHDVVAVAAYVHDIGYSTELCKTGFHPLDGARYLRSLGAPGTVCDLVAHHTSADAEAAERGLHAQLTEFADPPEELSDQLTYCDLHTSPSGEIVDVDQRMAEILRRYGADTPVHRALLASRSQLHAAVARVELRIREARSRSPKSG